MEPRAEYPCRKGFKPAIRAKATDGAPQRLQIFGFFYLVGERGTLQLAQVPRVLSAKNSMLARESSLHSRSQGGSTMRKTLMLLAAAAVALSAFAAFAEEPTIIGVPKCKMCHKAKTGDQFKIWSESKHAGAFETLKSEAAVAVATEKGLGNPWEEAACLKCHTTQAFLGVELDAKTKYVPEEGVGCEACHGAGSKYKSKKVMEDREAAVAAGLKLEGETNCVLCHNEESPTYKEFVFEERWAEIAHPIPEEAAE
jgi:hypothetical protein